MRTGAMYGLAVAHGAPYGIHGAPQAHAQP